MSRQLRWPRLYREARQVAGKFAGAWVGHQGLVVMVLWSWIFGYPLVQAFLLLGGIAGGIGAGLTSALTFWALVRDLHRGARKKELLASLQLVVFTGTVTACHLEQEEEHHDQAGRYTVEHYLFDFSPSHVEGLDDRGLTTSCALVPETLRLEIVYPRWRPSAKGIWSRLQVGREVRCLCFRLPGIEGWHLAKCLV